MSVTASTQTEFDPTATNTILNQLQYAFETWAPGEGQSLISQAYRHIEELRSQIDGMKATISELREINDRQRARIATLLRSEEEFRTKVRDAAKEVADGHSNHISFEQLNEWLSELGLDPFEIEFTVRVTLTATQQVEITVSATCEDEAKDKAVEDWGALLDNADRSDWDVTDTDVDEVEEA